MLSGVWQTDYASQRILVKDITDFIQNLHKKQRSITLYSLTEPTTGDMQLAWESVVEDTSHHTPYTKFFWYNPVTNTIDKVFTSLENIPNPTPSEYLEIEKVVASDWEFIGTINASNSTNVNEPLTINIPNTYKHLFVHYKVRSAVAAEEDVFFARLNNNSGAVYDGLVERLTDAAQTLTTSYAATSANIGFDQVPGNSSEKGALCAGFMFVFNYKTALHKNIIAISGTAAGLPFPIGAKQLYISYVARVALTAAITSLDFYVTTGTAFTPPTQITVWGIK